MAASSRIRCSRTTSRSRKPCSRMGTLMSRMASRGTRTRSRKVRPSGFTKTRTVTSVGISWARAPCPMNADNPTRAARAAVSLNIESKNSCVLLGMTSAWPVAYTGAHSGGAHSVRTKRGKDEELEAEKESSNRRGLSGRPHRTCYGPIHAGDDGVRFRRRR